MYIIKVNGMTEKLCRSFTEAKKYAKKAQRKSICIAQRKVAEGIEVVIR